MNTLAAILLWALFGLVVGAIARALYPGRQQMGLGMTMVLGITGSLLGGFLSRMLTNASDRPWLDGAGWIMSTIGALIIVWGVTALRQTRAT